MQRKRFIKLEEVDFETNLTKEDIIKIVGNYIQELGEPHEIDDGILYDMMPLPTQIPELSFITKDPVWYVDVIPIKVKEHFPDSYETLAISDRQKRIVYIINDHGRIVEIF